MLYNDSHLSEKEKEFKGACERRFKAFVHGVAPWLVTGHIHDDVCDWWQENMENGFTHQLALLPRGHLKSTLAYLWACWNIIKNPAIVIIYGSASGTLAEMQLTSIKTILTGDTVSYYWPGLIGPDEGKRRVWRLTEMTVDHPLRDELGVRDFTIRSVAIGTGVTGAHTDLLILDDVVAPESDRYSPWTVEGRAKLRSWYSFMSSVLNPECDVLVVGTRYHAKDLYDEMQLAMEDEFSPEGEIIGNVPVYQCVVRVVEENGNFLWPRKRGPRGEWYGFNKQVLSSKKANYFDKAKFFSQYYQNPVDPESGTFVKEVMFYNKENIIWRRNNWYLKSLAGQETLLNVFTAVDVASTENKDSDFTAIVTIGIDAHNNRYILDIDRFKSERISVIVDRVFVCYDKWRFRRVRIETTQAQRFVYTSIRDDMKNRNVFFNIDDYTPGVALGKKPERIRAILEPLYINKQMFHYRGGNCEILEDELVLVHPPHDDISDALASVCEIAQRPSIMEMPSDRPSQFEFHSRFGGVTNIA